MRRYEQDSEEFAQQTAVMDALPHAIHPIVGIWEPCPTVALLPDVQADDRGTTTPTPATTCAACGTTRTVCDAGLNTYDTRCCEQCGHGEGK